MLLYIRNQVREMGAFGLETDRNPSKRTETGHADNLLGSFRNEPDLESFASARKPRDLASQAKGREFESRRPLQYLP